MFFFSLVGILFFTYYLICIVLWIALDSDVELFFNSLAGKKTSKYLIFRNTNCLPTKPCPSLTRNLPINFQDPSPGKSSGSLVRQAALEEPSP